MNVLTSMSTDSVKKCQWQQRLALIRHNLHTASLTQDFGFFKALQALNVISSTDHVADLISALSSSPSAADEDQEDMADSLILSLDKFNTVMACVHEDAFKAVYDSVNAQANDLVTGPHERKRNYYKELSNQRRTAAESIDKMFNSASDAIRGQPSVVHGAAASVFIMGTTFIADAIEVCLANMDKMEGSLDDPDRLEAYWTTVQGAVATSVSGMKGVFKLMADDDSVSPSSVIARSISNEERRADSPEHQHARAASVDGYAKSMFRRMSTAFSSAGGSSTLPSRKASVSSFVSAPSRKSSIASAVSNPSHTRRLSTASNTSSAGSTGASHSTSANTSRSKTPIPHCGRTNHMSPIPSTPLTAAESGANAKVNPFDATFANNVAFQSNKTCHQTPDDTHLNSSKHARHRSRDIDLDDDDICPTTPTPTRPSQSQAKQQPLHARRNSSLRQGFSVPLTNTANGIGNGNGMGHDAVFASNQSQDPRTTTNSSHDTPVNGIISPTSSPTFGVSTAHAPSSSVGSVADIVGTLPFGLRRRSMNVVSGERPFVNLGGVGVEEGL